MNVQHSIDHELTIMRRFRWSDHIFENVRQDKEVARYHGTVGVNVIGHQLDCMVGVEVKLEKRLVFARLACQFLLHTIRLDLSTVVVLATNQIFISRCIVRTSFRCVINLILGFREVTARFMWIYFSWTSRFSFCYIYLMLNTFTQLNGVAHAKLCFYVLSSNI